MRELTERQARFVAEYRKDGNGKRSAIAAGYSAKTAEVTASKLLRHPKVRERLEVHTKAALAPLEITADTVQRELALIAFGRMGSFYSDTGKLLEAYELPEAEQARLSSIKVTQERTVATTDGVTEISVEQAVIEYKTFDKVRSLELLGRHLGMFTERVAVSADVSLLEVCRAIEAREKERAANAAAIDAEVVPA